MMSKKSEPVPERLPEFRQRLLPLVADGVDLGIKEGPWPDPGRSDDLLEQYAAFSGEDWELFDDELLWILQDPKSGYLIGVCDVGEAYVWWWQIEWPELNYDMQLADEDPVVRLCRGLGHYPMRFVVDYLGHREKCHTGERFVGMDPMPKEPWSARFAWKHYRRRIITVQEARDEGLMVKWRRRY